jgi:hypothetical protein
MEAQILGWILKILRIVQGPAVFVSTAGPCGSGLAREGVAIFNIDAS